VENVAALLSGPSEQRGGWFGSILGDLAECGYDAEWENIPAAAVGAPHRRERVWIVAYPNNLGGTALRGKRQDSERQGVAGGIDRTRSVPNAQREVPIFSTGKNSRDVADATQLQRNGSGEHRQPSKRQVSKSGKRSGAEPMANADNQGLQGRTQAGNPSGIRSGGYQFFERCAYMPRAAWLPEPDVGRVANGVPQRVDRLKGLGNAVVPQIPELIGRAIMEAEGMT
jgi:DNA (cytosine-5)-methyltransferase 1